MPIDYGQIYNNGIKYIKINKFDKNGIDNANKLQDADSITINYPDIGPQTYVIITNQPQQDYYLIGINASPLTSSINTIPNYNTKATTSTISSLDSIFYTASNFTINNGNSLSYLNSTTGVYTLGNTPNTPIKFIFTASIAPTNWTGNFAIINLEDTEYESVLSSGFVIPAGPGPNVTVSGSIILSSSNNGVVPFIENTNLGIGFYKATGTNISINSFEVIISGSNSPITSSTLIVFNPEEDFYYSDYNALFGNAETPQFSSQFMDVDYTSTFTTPVNFDLIISGTADRAQVQDSNYSSQAWSNIRYNGVRSDSSDFNRLTRNGGYGSSPNVEQNQTYIAYFDGVGGTGPEIIGQTAYFIKYLIDEQGNVVNPEPDTIALYNLLDSYESGKNALIRLISGDPAQSSNPNDDSLTGLHPITHVGRISPILMSETGSNFADTASILYFDDFAKYSVISTPEYGFRAITTTDTSIPYSDPEYTIICNLETFASAEYNNGTGVYTFPSNTYTYYNRVNFTANGQIKGFFANNSPLGSTFTVTVRIKNNGNIIPYQDVVFTKSINNPYATSYIESFNFNTGFQNFNIGDVITLTYDGVASPGISSANPTLLSGITFKAQNEYPAASLTASAPYWTIGTYLTGSNVSVLTSSLDLINYYDPSLYQSQSQAMLDWGFNPVSLAFQPQAGDFIRIEYNPDKVFNITKVEATDRLYLTVVPPIPTGSFLNHFVLYRIINDGTYVVLDVDKIQAGSSFTGIIQPQYISQTLKTNYNDIIQNLTSKGLIS